MPVALLPLISGTTLIPDSISNVIIAFGGAALSLCAVGVEFRSIANASMPVLREEARKNMRITAVVLVGFCIAYGTLVTRVDYKDSKITRSYVTAWTGTYKEPCIGESKASCIQMLLPNGQGRVDHYFGEDRIQISKLILEFLYIGFYACFGNLVGILVVIWGKRRGK